MEQQMLAKWLHILQIMHILFRFKALKLTRSYQLTWEVRGKAAYETSSVD
jgi:hypothetical protein